MIMNLANILKIAPGILKAGEVAAIAANDGYQSTVSKALGATATAAGIASSVVPSSGTANTTTPSGTPVQPGKHPVAPPPPVKPDLAPQTPFKPDMQGKTGAQKQQLTKAVNQQNAWLKQQQAPKAELLKVKSTIPKASNPNDQANITKGYLKGLEQSGAKLDNKGQIVKQSGKAFKKPGWDRKAQLMGGRRTPDRLQKLRMLAIDKAANAEGIKAATGMDPNKAQTKDEAKIWSLDGKSEEELKEVVNRLGLSDYRL